MMQPPPPVWSESDFSCNLCSAFVIFLSTPINVYGASPPYWNPKYATDWICETSTKCVTCAAFWSFFLWLNCKIRVTRLLVTVRVFCLIHTALKCTKTYYFGAKKIFGSTLHPYWRLRRLTPVNIWIVTPKKHFLLISDITEMHQKR